MLRVLATDDEFLEALLARITVRAWLSRRPRSITSSQGPQNPNEHNADLMAMLLANLAKADEIKGVLTRTGGRPLEPLSTSENVMDQLVDCFVKGADAGFNKTTNFEYLAYFFADLAKVGGSSPENAACRCPNRSVVLRRPGVLSQPTSLRLDNPSQQADCVHRARKHRATKRRCLNGQVSLVRLLENPVLAAYFLFTALAQKRCIQHSIPPDSFIEFQSQSSALYTASARGTRRLR